MTENEWGAKMTRFAAGDLTRNTRNPFDAFTTGRETQVALDAVDMPKDLGRLLDKGIEDHFRDH